MTCVLGMVVRREREIRDFVKTPFYRVVSTIDAQGHQFEGEWKAVKGSRYFESYDLYKENGFKEREKAEELIRFLLEGVDQKEARSVGSNRLRRKRKRKNPPLLYNLAELQNDCSKYFKISPDETLRIVQELYEKEACNLSENRCKGTFHSSGKEISRNLNGLSKYPMAALLSERYPGIWKL